MENYSNTSIKTLNKASERFLVLLKTKGPQSAAVFAREFSITGEAARLQLIRLMEQELVQSKTISKGVGRPSIVFSLTEKGYAYFPDTHAELTAQLLHNIKEALGEKALNAVITLREKEADDKYASEMGTYSLEEKLTHLAAIRSKEGYMAEWKKEANEYIFIQNHCPICSAASNYPEFCQAELNNFQRLMGNNVTVKRTDHIVEGARRCVYRVEEG